MVKLTGRLTLLQNGLIDILFGWLILIENLSTYRPSIRLFRVSDTGEPSVAPWASACGYPGRPSGCHLHPRLPPDDWTMHHWPPLLPGASAPPETTSSYCKASPDMTLLRRHSRPRPRRWPTVGNSGPSTATDPHRHRRTCPRVLRLLRPGRSPGMGHRSVDAWPTGMLLHRPATRYAACFPGDRLVYRRPWHGRRTPAA